MSYMCSGSPLLHPRDRLCNHNMVVIVHLNSKKNHSAIQSYCYNNEKKYLQHNFVNYIYMYKTIVSYDLSFNAMLPPYQHLSVQNPRQRLTLGRGVPQAG